MGKLFLILLVAFGAAMYFPRSRAVVMETAEPALNPVFRWSTRGEMRKIARDLETEEESSRRFPRRQTEFVDWLSRQYQGDTALQDAWGSEYALHAAARSFRLISAGPDRALGTEDDLEITGARHNGR